MKLKELYQDQIEESWVNNKIQSIRDFSNRLTGHRNLYHITGVKSFLNIIKSDAFNGSTFDNEPKVLQTEGYKGFISTATSLKSTYILEWFMGVMGGSLHNVLIVFDGRKMKNKYSVIPANYFKELYKQQSNTPFIDDHLLYHIGKYNDEKEQRVLLKRKRAYDISKYIRYVVITPGMDIEQVIKGDNNHDSSSLQLKKEKELKKIKEAAEKRGIDLYYASTYSDLVNNNIKKLE